MLLPASCDFGSRILLANFVNNCASAKKFFSPSAHNVAFPGRIGSIRLAYCLRHRTLFTVQCNNFACQLSLLLLILTELFHIQQLNKFNFILFYLTNSNFAPTLCNVQRAVAPDLEKIRDQEMDFKQNKR